MIIKIFVGFFAGLTASMGLGGGFLLMIYLLNFAGFSQLHAQMINLMFFIPIAITSSILHIKNRLIEKRPLVYFLVFGILGVFLGSFFIYFLPVKFLKKIFSVLLLIFGLKEIFHK